MDLKTLTVIGVIDGVIVAAPLVGAGYRWPEHQGIVWALAVVVFVGGFLATVMGALFTYGNRERKDVILLNSQALSEEEIEKVKAEWGKATRMITIGHDVILVPKDYWVNQDPE